MRPGDVVAHCRSGRRMTIERIDGSVAECVWFGGPVDCRFGGPYAEADGGPRWRGFNVGPREYATGAACVPVECSVVAGDVPQEWL